MTDSMIPNGAVMVLFNDKLHCTIKTKPVEESKAKELADHYTDVVLSTYGLEAMFDLGQCLSCELVNSLNLAKKNRLTNRKKATRLEQEAAEFAVAIQYIEKSPYVEIRHYPKDQMTGIKVLEVLTEEEAMKQYCEGVPVMAI